MTHDSIGLGEDGPTHQPVEHLAALRAIPGLCVYRPADPIETAECWALALHRRNAPALLALTRQSLPLLRHDPSAENRSAYGAYVLAEAEGARQVTLLATGSEVSIAIEARELLAKSGVRAAVVSMPCWELFEAQSQQYRDQVLGVGARGSRSRLPSNSAGIAGSGRMARLSACTDLAPRPRARRSTSILALRPKRLLKPPARSYRFDKILRRSER